MPEFSQDDVLNFMVNEALVVRAGHERKKAEKTAEREAFRKSHKQFDPNSPPQGG